jgi:hypothetical protein
MMPKDDVVVQHVAVQQMAMMLKASTWGGAIQSSSTTVPSRVIVDHDTVQSAASALKTVVPGELQAEPDTEEGSGSRTSYAAGSTAESQNTRPATSNAGSAQMMTVEPVSAAAAAAAPSISGFISPGTSLGGYLLETGTNKLRRSPVRSSACLS